MLSSECIIHNSDSTGYVQQAVKRSTDAIQNFPSCSVRNQVKQDVNHAWRAARNFIITSKRKVDGPVHSIMLALRKRIWRRRRRDGGQTGPRRCKHGGSIEESCSLTSILIRPSTRLHFFSFRSDIMGSLCFWGPGPWASGR